METIKKEAPAQKPVTPRYDPRPRFYLGSEDARAVEKLQAGQKYIMTAEVLCEEQRIKEPAQGKTEYAVTLRMTKVDFKLKKADNDLASILADEEKRQVNKAS